MSETINFKTGWIKDPEDGQKFAPKTTTNQVLTGDGERLTDILQTLQTNIDSILGNVVDLTSDQTVTGTKTFENGIQIGDASLTYDTEYKRILFAFPE